MPSKVKRVSSEDAHHRVFSLHMRYWPRLFVQDSCILAKFFFAFLLTADEVEVNRKAQITRPLFSHLDRTSLVSKGFITRTKRTLFLVEPTREIPRRQDEPIQPTWLANQNVGSPSSYPLAIQLYNTELLLFGSFLQWAILRLRMNDRGLVFCQNAQWF